MGNKQRIFFRADASGKIGLGHVIRSLALAEMLGDDYYKIFLSRNLNTSIAENVTRVCDELITLDSEDEEISKIKKSYKEGDIIVLDGYQFNYEYQTSLFNHGFKIASIDDISNTTFNTQVIINHGGGFSASDYQDLGNSIYFLGPKYALLRPAFISAAKEKKSSLNMTDSIFICFGGADPNNETLRTLEFCIEQGYEELHIVIGAAYNHKAQLLDKIKQKGINASLYVNVSAEEMVIIMKKCEIGITSPSTVSYEFLSVNARLFLKVIADNQKRIYKYMLENSLAKPLEKLPRKEDITVQCYEKSTIFDGQQKEKYQQLFEGLSLNLRPAQKMDSLLYFNWANDPSVRIHSFSSEEIKLKDHQTWFDNKLTSADTYLFVVHQNLEPIGQIRLEIIDNNALISYSIAAQYRGKGYSKFVLQLGINKIKEVKKDIKEVYGFVKISNIASCKVFKRLNFKEQQTDLYPKSLKFTKNVI